MGDGVKTRSICELETFVTSVRTVKTMNYCTLPKEQWLQLGLLNNMT